MPLSSTWQIAQMGYFGGSGTSDILLRNTNGMMVDWSMNAAQIASSSQDTSQGRPATPRWLEHRREPTDFLA